MIIGKRMMTKPGKWGGGELLEMEEEWWKKVKERLPDLFIDR